MSPKVLLAERERSKQKIMSVGELIDDPKIAYY
jgi:hypothetical protein